MINLFVNWIGSSRNLLIKRHFSIIVRHLSIKKVFNLFLVYIDFALRRPIPYGKPVYIKIEPTRLCNLKCTGCVHSTKEFLSTIDHENFFDLKEFKKIIDNIADTLIGISFAYYGEPLLDDSLLKMVKYAHRRRIGTMFPTNLSIKLSDEKIKEFVNSGLDMIMVSLDGATKETYSKYRIGGDFDLILENVKRIGRAKNQMGSSLPNIRWKYTIFDHNKNEIEIAKKNYKKLGFDTLSIHCDMYDINSNDRKLRNLYNNNLGVKRTACFWLWFTLVVEYNGNISPCCGLDDLKTLDTFHLGNAFEKPILEIWKGKRYQKIRRGFKKDEGQKELHPTCQKCIGLMNV